MSDLYNQLSSLAEREKELKCLYNVDQCLNGNDLYNILRNIAGCIPSGWQYPNACFVEINCYDIRVRSPRFELTGNCLNSDIKSGARTFGNLSVYYPKSIGEITPEFLPEEQLLLNAIARRISQFLSLSSTDITNNEEYIESHWEWRMRMANEICHYADFGDLQIQSVYIAGSTKNASAGPASDIDLIIVHTAENTIKITEYFRGWSHCLASWNEMRTGIKQKDGLLDIHLLHKNELGSANSWATMLKSSENSAKLIKSII